MMPTGEVGYHGGQAWPNRVGADFWGNRGAVEVAVALASAGMRLMFGNLAGQFGQVGDLMLNRSGVMRPGVGGHVGVTMGAYSRHIRHDRVDPLGRKTTTKMPGMSDLPTELASSRTFVHRLRSIQGVGRRRYRGVGGVQVQLLLEFAHKLFEFGDAYFEFRAPRTTGS
jgi:hypothetical protein